MTTPALNNDAASKPQSLALGQHAHLEENPLALRQCIRLEDAAATSSTTAPVSKRHTRLEDATAVSSTTTLRQTR
jgi:hypothetical protein